MPAIDAGHACSYLRPADLQASQERSFAPLYAKLCLVMVELPGLR